MKNILFAVGAIALSLVMALGCGGDGTTGPGPLPSNVPPIPVPGSPTEVLPSASSILNVGLSTPIPEFAPIAADLQMMQDNGTAPWIPMNRRILLACPGGLPEYTCDRNLPDRSYVSARPSILHQRYWRKVKQVTLDPGTGYEQSETISYGTSTSHEESREFSWTIGVETEVGGSWEGLSASVKASYQATETRSEVNAVTFSTESVKSETYSVEADPDHTRLYALWQLVDRFSLVDADTTRIHESPTLRHVRVPELADIEFPNRDVIYQSVTKFD
jgi:hypothetical protein